MAQDINTNASAASNEEIIEETIASAASTIVEAQPEVQPEAQPKTLEEIAIETGGVLLPPSQTLRHDH